MLCYAMPGQRTTSFARKEKQDNHDSESGVYVCIHVLCRVVLYCLVSSTTTTNHHHIIITNRRSIDIYPRSPQRPSAATPRRTRTRGPRPSGAYRTDRKSTWRRTGSSGSRRGGRGPRSSPRSSAGRSG